MKYTIGGVQKRQRHSSHVRAQTFVFFLSLLSPHSSHLRYTPTIIHDNEHYHGFGDLQGHHSNSAPNVSHDCSTTVGANRVVAVFAASVKRLDEERQEQQKL